jgi:hypothetical protein
MKRSPVLRAAAPGEERSYQCSACGKTFRLLNALNHHVMTRHAGQAKVIVVGKDGRPIEGEAAVSLPAAGSSATAPKPPAAGAAKPTPGGFPFPGMFTPAAPAPPSPSVATPVGSPPAQPSDEGATADADKKLFVCTICQKTFRLEAALQHHYQAKHNMEMPSASPTGAATSPAGQPSAATTASVPEAESAAQPSSSTQYIHAQDGSLPQATQYHLDVAPNAPEEGEIACHWRCVNHFLLMGTVQDVQEGYVFEDPVVQFTLVTEFAGPSPGEPDKDFHTVRVFGSEFAKSTKAVLEEGQRVMVSGRLRLVPQFEAATNKYYHYPIMAVHSGSGTVVRV